VVVVVGDGIGARVGGKIGEESMGEAVVHVCRLYEQRGACGTCACVRLATIRTLFMWSRRAISFIGTSM
jgi:hypothetical protein